MAVTIQYRDGKGVRLAGALRKGRWRRLWSFLVRLNAERRARKQLARLDEATLKDIGLSCGDVEFVLSRPLWEIADLSWLQERRRPANGPNRRP